jgi:hypothetical protein
MAPYNDRMPRERSHADSLELNALVDRLREELHASGATADGAAEHRARRELERLWAVTAERPNLYRPGRWGRLRGALLVPPKAVLRRLLRWYVEPLATDQRAFNSGVLRLADELAADLAHLEERVLQLEGAQDAPSRRSP